MRYAIPPYGLKGIPIVETPALRWDQILYGGDAPLTGLFGGGPAFFVGEVGHLMWAAALYDHHTRARDAYDALLVRMFDASLLHGCGFGR